MAQENINLSEMTINGVIFTLKDGAAQNDIQNITSAIVTNNISISERINNLNERSFDSLIKISSNNDTEISNINDGLYKIQYVTVETIEEETIETINNVAILFQKGINQYLIKDGSILYRTKTNNIWNEWQSKEVLSANYEMSSDSNDDLTLEAGDTYEEAFAKLEKAIIDNEIVIANSLYDLDSQKIPKVSNPTTDNFASFNSDGTIKDSGSSASDFITSIKTVNNESLVGTGNIVISGLPEVSASDNGKILMVVDGQWQLVSPSV